MKAPRLEPARDWSEVASVYRKEILHRMSLMAAGYHFAGLRGMEAYVKLAIAELRRAARRGK